MSNPATSRTTPTAAPPEQLNNGELHNHPVAENVQSTAATTAAAPYAVFDRPYMLPRTHPLQFQTNTIAPSPPLQGQPFFSETAPIDIQSPGSDNSQDSSSSSLRISTDIPAHHFISLHRQSSLNGCSGSSSTRGSIAINKKTSMGSLQPISRTPSLKAALSQSLGGSGSGSSSLVPSPIISAMGDLSPLPSPLLPADSPGPWRRLLNGASPGMRSRLNSVGEDSVLSTSLGEMEALSNNAQRNIFPAMEPPKPSTLAPRDFKRQHTRNRSNSEYIPEVMSFAKRQISVPGAHSALDPSNTNESHNMRRELNFAEARGLTPTVRQPPTPPPSESSKDSTEIPRPKDLGELFEARGRRDKKRRRWRALRCLGQGTFSRVMLATSQIIPREGEGDPANPNGQPDRKTLVAVKVCEHGPRGGASEERVEMSLKRELEILQCIHHPSIVDLIAFSIEPTRAILVLCYSAGGDLFDVATSGRNILTPALLRRVFAELVGAVKYLHDMNICHRDIKLENVLVNLTTKELSDPSIDWTTYPQSVITLADLGLSRRIKDDEKLETRCGSDDYAAPEVIMGQPYDGRAIDAWSLGVLLYALLESRLPFDPHPGMTDAHRMRSRTSHRIARVEWRWLAYAGDDTDHDGDEAKFEAKGLVGAMEITEGLLKRARSRWTLDKVAAKPWVKDALQIEGGLKFWEQEEGEEIE